MTLPPLALVLDALPGPVPAALGRAAALGYEWVELRGAVDRPTEDLEALAECGLLVAGVELTAAEAGSSMPQRRAALAELRGQIADAGRLGARYLLFDPAPFAGEASATYIEVCSLLAEAAAERMMPLCLAGPATGPLPITHRNTRYWLHLSSLTGTASALRPDIGAVRVRFINLSNLADLHTLCETLSLRGFYQPLAVWPEPIRALSDLRMTGPSTPSDRSL
jgi:hypothetical protein